MQPTKALEPEKWLKSIFRFQTINPDLRRENKQKTKNWGKNER
jgi:hypothetical protein